MRLDLSWARRTRVLEVTIDVSIVTPMRMAERILLVSYGAFAPQLLPETADYLQWKNLRIISATLKSMEGI